MTRRGTTLALAVAGAMLVAGCGDENSVPPPETAGPTEPQTIQAVAPAMMVRRVSRRPQFQWKLPPRMAQPTTVTFLLAEAGTGDQPAADLPDIDATDTPRVVTATCLADTSPEAINLWEPPSGAIVTGEIHDMAQLAPDTWYRWRVRVVAPGAAGHADFYFRTRTESAVPQAGGTEAMGQKPASGPSGGTP